MESVSDQRSDAHERIEKMIRHQLPGDLRNRGFTPFRIGEFLHPVTERHVRFGYAGGEWTITVSHRRRHQYRTLRTIRLDDRRYTGKALPSAASLVAQIVA